MSAASIIVYDVKINGYQGYDGQWGSEVLVKFRMPASGSLIQHSCSRVNYPIVNSPSNKEAQKAAFIKRAAQWA